MIEEKDISMLLSQWKSRIDNNQHSNDYTIAVSECSYDLQNLLRQNLSEDINNLPSEEIEEYLIELEADNYLASLEAHEPAA